MRAMSDAPLGPGTAPTIIDATDHSPVILHAPHGSTEIPDRWRRHFLVDDAAIDRELLALTDHGVDRMVRGTLEATTASAVIAEVSRLVVDVERFPGDEEEMNAVGMGVLYTHGAWRERIRDVPADDRSALLEHFAAYSTAVERLVDRALEQHGRAVIIDVHSYPTHAMPFELHGDGPRPELCIGFDRRHASEPLIGAVRSVFERFSHVENSPFIGAYVPLRHYGRDPRVEAVMLEIRRDQYMDEASGGLDGAAVDALSASIAELVERVGPGFAAR